MKKNNVQFVSIVKDGDCVYRDKVAMCDECAKMYTSNPDMKVIGRTNEGCYNCDREDSHNGIGRDDFEDGCYCY